MQTSTRIRPNPSHTFECLVKVLPPKNGQAPEMHVLYPPEFEWDEETKRNLPKFCYPCEDYSPRISQHFSFVLTDLESKYRFGHCLYPPGADGCHCFFSHLPWHDFFYLLLDRLSEIGLPKVAIACPLLDSVYSHPSCQTWHNGDISSVAFQFKNPKTSEIEDLVLKVPDPTKLPSLPGNHNLNTFHVNLSHNVLLAVLASLIFERRILMTSKNIEVLTGCVQGAAMVLYPLYWQHIFCPVLPPHLMDYCCAPMPFLIGVHSSLMERVNKMPLGDIVIVDIDAQTLESHYDDLGEFPDALVHPLKHVLKKPSSATGESVAKAFLITFAALIGRYKEAFTIKTKETEVDGKVEKKKEFEFDPDVFIHTRPEMSALLENLLHSQNFQQFIKARVDSANCGSKAVYRDLFDNERQAMEDEWKKNWKNPDAMKRAFQKNNSKIREQIKVGYKKLKKNFEASANIDDSSSLRHNLEELDLEAVRIKAKMQRKGPPRPPKPYAKHKEERATPLSLPLYEGDEQNDGEEDDGPSSVPIGNLLQLTPTRSQESWMKTKINGGMGSSDSDSLLSSSSSSEDCSVIVLPPPPVPPPRSNRRRTVINPMSTSAAATTPTTPTRGHHHPQALSEDEHRESEDVIGNIPAITDADWRRSKFSEDPKRESLDLTGSLALALVDIDPHIAQTLQHYKMDRHPSADLPPPLEPVRSTSQGSTAGALISTGQAATNPFAPGGEFDVGSGSMSRSEWDSTARQQSSVLLPTPAIQLPCIQQQQQQQRQQGSTSHSPELNSNQATGKGNSFLSSSGGSVGGQPRNERSDSPFADLLKDEWFSAMKTSANASSS